MTEAQHAEPGTNQDRDSSNPPGVPRWVKVCGVIVAIILLLFVVGMIAGGKHGPGMHTRSAPATLDMSNVSASPINSATNGQPRPAAAAAW